MIWASPPAAAFLSFVGWRLPNSIVLRRAQPALTLVLFLWWSDIPPTTIRDKGKWAVSGNEITLTSDPDIKWKPGAERHYLMIHRSAHADEILVGTDSDSRYFEKNAKEDPEFMLLLVSKARINVISEKDTNE